MIREVSKERLSSFSDYDNHESVYSFYDEGIGLKGFVAVHSTRLGPATGGTRYWTYASEDDALRDALRLSRAMTYKCGVSGVPHGGGKAVIMRDPAHRKNPSMMARYGEYINELNGRFTTGEDVGITEGDIVAMAGVSPYINGLPHGAGDPSPWASRSVRVCLEEALRSFGVAPFDGVSVSIKGVGKVGAELARSLAGSGATLVVSDIDTEALESLRRTLPDIRVVSPDISHKELVHVYAPCALGGEFTHGTIPEVIPPIVCGAANNQLADSSMGARLHARGILYIPDYLANAGGLINVVDALRPGGYSRDRVEENINKLAVTLRELIVRSNEQEIHLSVAVDTFVEERLRD